MQNECEIHKLFRAFPASLSSFPRCFPGNGTRLFQLACEEDLEGIVARRKDGLYTPEETSWVKVKNPAYSQAEGRHKLFQKRLHASA